MSPTLSHRCAAEFLGTFAIVFFGCGSIATVGQDGSLAGHLAVNLVFGLTVGAMIYALGHASAAHFNPAVTVGFAVARRFPWRCVPSYAGAQVGGALLGSGLHGLLLAQHAASARYGATLPTLGGGRACGVEVVLTFFLMLVIPAVATDRRASQGFAGLAIGATACLCGLFGGPLSGCSMNPARSLAPALFAGPVARECLWIYILGPLAWAAMAAVVYEAIRGGEEHARGAPGDLCIVGGRAWRPQETDAVRRDRA